MGISGVSIGSLIVIFLIVLLLFGTKKLKNIGHDLGSAIKDFKKGVEDESKEGDESKSQTKHHE